MTLIKPDDRARRYRELAAETRAIADVMIHENARKGMLEAASVWDRLAEIVERQLNGPVDSMPPPASRRPYI